MIVNLSKTVFLSPLKIAYKFQLSVASTTVSLAVHESVYISLKQLIFVSTPRGNDMYTICN